MKILEAFGEPISNGGQESFVMNVVTHMDLSNKTVDLLTPYYCDNEHYRKQIESLGGKVFTFNKQFAPGKSRFNICDELDDFFNENKYDVVHIHSGSISILGIFAHYAKKNGVKKVIVHSHCSIETFTLKNRALRTIFGYWMKDNVDVYCACSNLAAKAKFTDEIAKNKVIILKNGIDLDRFKYNESIRNYIRTDLGIDNSCFVVGHVGRFSYQKNHDFLIDIFFEVQKIIKDSKLLLIGSGELEKEVHKKINDLDIEEKVIFCGNVNDVYNYYQAMDCFVLPSRFEGLPIVGIEAQAAGLPCFFANTISNELDISDLCNYISLNNNPEKWAQKISDNINIERIDMSEKISKAGFDIDECVIKIETIVYRY